MRVQQPFDDGMSAADKSAHVKEWLDDLQGKGFTTELTLFGLNHKKQTFEPIEPNDYENALGYRIDATPEK
jgi:hypothetical protein